MSWGLSVRGLSDYTGSDLARKDGLLEIYEWIGRIAIGATGESFVVQIPLSDLRSLWVLVLRFASCARVDGLRFQKLKLTRDPVLSQLASAGGLLYLEGAFPFACLLIRSMKQGKGEGCEEAGSEQITKSSDNQVSRWELTI